jgi:hypothetical protein
VSHHRVPLINHSTLLPPAGALANTQFPSSIAHALSSFVVTYRKPRTVPANRLWHRLWPLLPRASWMPVANMASYAISSEFDFGDS